MVCTLCVCVWVCARAHAETMSHANEWNVGLARTEIRLIGALKYAAQNHTTGASTYPLQVHFTQLPAPI